MKSKFLFPTLLFIAMIALVSCHERVRGKGAAVTTNRNISQFTEVNVSGSIDVQLAQGPFAVQVVAQSNLQPYIETYVQNGQLVVTQKPNTRLRTTEKMLVRVTMPDIEGLKVSGSSEIEATTLLKSSRRVDLQVSGSGQMALKLNAPEIKANVSGSGTIAMQGDCRDFIAQVSGSGNIDANNLRAETVEAKVTGSGDLSVFGSRNIMANVSGSGDLTYTGGGMVQSKKTGSGSIRPL